MLASEIIDEIRTQARSGFYDKEYLMTMFCEMRYEPGELSPDEVSTALDHEFDDLAIEKSRWPKVTDCDRLDRAFEALRERALIALQNAGYTQSEGYGEVCEACVDIADEDSIIGYCFYDGQDLERAVRGGGLYLAFGPADPKDETSQGPVVGRVICEELQRAGFEVKWNGTFDQRIYVPQILWQRR